MFPASFDYHRAESVDDALALLGRLADAEVLAGGQSLIPMMKLRLLQPAAVVDIGGLAELRGIAETGGTVRIGALTTHAELAKSDLLRRRCPLLAEAAAVVADPQVRNRGTIGGNLAHADPASDLPGVVLALGATLRLRGPGGARAVAAGDFFRGLMETDVGEGELLTAVEVPVRTGRTGSAYVKFEHPASGYAVCGAAAVVTLGDGGRVERARLCFNGITATPLDAAAVAGALAGGDAADAAIAAAVAGLAVAEPLADPFASGPYRVALAREHGRRALALARDRARE
jgi:carbon-monoxide dehydrogenase medium subunit